VAIEHISDTARWVAVHRAVESERPDAIFNDPFARRLAGDRGNDIVRGMRRDSSVAWSTVVRTAVFDEIILDLVGDGRAGAVLNLAAGLDARPWRLPLPPALRWIDADLPGILDYKAGVLRDERPACFYEAVAADLTDAGARAAVFARAGAAADRVLVVTEGLLVYLTAEQVGALAGQLAQVPSVRWWLTDLASPMLLKMMNRQWGRAVRAGNAPFQFGPAEGTAFFAPFGWRELAARLPVDEARRLHREMPGYRFWQFVARFYPPRLREKFRRMSFLVLLARDAAPVSDGSPTR
jgi:methyltransferase (TIGR00027 family)